MPEREHLTVKFDIQDDEWVSNGAMSYRCIFHGPLNDPDAPVGIAIKAGPDVADYVAGTRSHSSASTIVVLEGAIQHNRRWMTRGEMFVAPPHVEHSDLLFGPDGAVIFIYFANRSGLVPKFSDAGDQARFDAEFRKQVEDVASGRVEKSVVLLPLRDHYTLRRGVIVTDMDAYTGEV